MKNTQEAVAVSITFCSFIKITDCSDQLNTKTLRQEIFEIFSEKMQFFKNI